MPEALIVLFVFVVAAASYVGARFTARDAARRATPPAELSRLRQQRAWLEERFQRAWREDWDDAMRGRLAAEINEVQAALAQAPTEGRKTS